MKRALVFLCGLVCLACASPLAASYTNTLATAGYLTKGTAEATTTATLAGWFRVGATSSSACVLFFNGYNGGNGWGFYCPAGSRVVNMLRGGIAVTTGSVALTQDVWTHVAMTRNGSSIELFIDGVSVLTDSGTIVTPNTGFLALGDSFASSPPVVAGAELAYYTRVLSSDEIKALAKALRPLKVRDPYFYWPLVRNLEEAMKGNAMSITGSGVSSTDHPRIYR